MKDEIAISVKGVSKNFKLPHEKADSVKSVFVDPFNKNRKKFEQQHALRDISFDVKKGEFFGIVGRNGSGKSTLLKIIAGIYQPNEGKVTVNGRLVPFIELGVGFNPELTGRENTYLNGALMGFSEKEVNEKYNAIVDFAELDKFMDQKLKNYSSGMQVRLAFSVATILAESDILLIDEVLAVGDADFQRKCFDYFKKLKKNKKTVIFVSHDMDAIAQYCDRAILIDKNVVRFKGDAEATSQEYTKLFHENTPGAYDKGIKGAQLKWGVGGVDVFDIRSHKSTYRESDEYVELSYSIIADGYTGSIIPGITIRDEQGRSVCGVNSRLLKIHKDKLTLSNKAETIRTKWSVPNIFNEGVYIVEPAVIDEDGSNTLVWWNEALSFNVINQQTAPVHLVSPKIKLTLD